MAFADDLRQQVDSIFKGQWTTREGLVVPEYDTVKLGNDAVKISGTVLYADLSASTNLVDNHEDYLCAEIYKAYLYCAARIIRIQGGVITAYDGDRVMGVFIGDSKNSSAAKCGLKINWAVKDIINPAISNQYPQINYAVQQTVGIDTSQLFVARTGVRGANDLVWVGRAANYAAKLTSLDPAYPTRITKDVYESLNDESKYSNGKDMWQKARWTSMDNIDIYRSTWKWSL